MELIRVFPRRTSYTPRDDLAFVGDPPLIRPDADEVHVSATFTWDMSEARRLQQAWGQYYPRVRLGGPAVATALSAFVPGRYLKPGVTFTTRGCNSRCSWCLVPEREGRLALRAFPLGWIIQDNNLLQAPREHIEAVLDMLEKQPKAAIFGGGLQASLVSDWFAARLQKMRIDQVFLAADTRAALKPLQRAVDTLALGRHKTRCYVLCGFKNEFIEEARERLEAVWAIGAMPFAQLYQPPDRFIDYPRPWKALAREWSRPAAMVAAHTVIP